MRKSTVTALTVLLALLAIIVPLVAAIGMAQRQARANQTDVVAGLSQDMIARWANTNNQALVAFAALRAAHTQDPCSKASLAIMRHYDLSSDYLQSIGYTSGNHLVCSSQGTDSDAGVFDLGPPDWVRSDGVKVRIDVKFPFDRDTVYLVLESPEGYTAVINKSLPIDITPHVGDVSLMFFNRAERRIWAQTGYIDPNWLPPKNSKTPSKPETTTFIDHGYIVAISGTTNMFAGAIAAIPVSHIYAQTRRTAQILLPLGGITGLILALIAAYYGRRQLGMPALLRVGLKRREFFMYYQPVVDLRTGKIAGAEALIRWRRPDGEMVRPDIFIPAAEDAGIIRRMTRHVVDLVGEDVEDLFERRPDFHIAVNLSNADLHSTDTVFMLEQMARKTQAHRGSLILEVTERGLIQKDAAAPIIKELRARGFKVAIDDFGTGYSSLASLENFELDYLKIDKSFVDTMNLQTPTSQVALHIIDMAKSLNMEMVAEGVESREQALYLRDRGVQYAQGFFFSRPVPMAELISLIQGAPIFPPSPVTSLKAAREARA